MTFDTVVRDMYTKDDIKAFNALCALCEDLQANDKNGTFVDIPRELLQGDYEAEQIFIDLYATLDRWYADGHTRGIMPEFDADLYNDIYDMKVCVHDVQELFSYSDTWG